MSEHVRGAAQRQLDAYNAHDIDAFVRCYHRDVTIRDLRSNELMGQGHDYLTQAYGPMFEATPDLHAQVTTRTIVGDLAFDCEYVTGRGDPIIVMATYRVDADGVITDVWFAKP